MIPHCEGCITFTTRMRVKTKGWGISRGPGIARIALTGNETVLGVAPHARDHRRQTI